MFQKKIVYIFLDEGGNLDFSRKGTKYFTLTCLAKVRPFSGYKELTELKYNLMEQGKNIEYFHASEDRQDVRDQVFGVIEKYRNKIRVDSLIVEKQKIETALQDSDKFFPKMLGFLIPHTIKALISKNSDIDQILIFTDTFPVKSRKRAMEKAIKKILAAELSGVPYRIYHHSSRSNSYLQMADYLNWAIFRKWERGDTRSYDLIQGAVKSEIEIFHSGD